MAQTNGFASTIRATGMPPVRIQPNDQGGATFIVESESGDGRFATLNNEGGVWKLTLLGHLPDGCAFGALDGDGRIVPIFG